MRHLPTGATAVVRSPATSANLGPGFDCLGLALDLWDEYAATVTDRPGVRVTSTGEGAADLPGDATHLVARSLLAGLSAAGCEAGDWSCPAATRSRTVVGWAHRRPRSSADCRWHERWWAQMR